MTTKWTFWIGIFASATFFIVLALVLTDVGQIVESIRQANLYYVAPSLVLYFAAVYARTVRWNYLLRPLLGRPTRPVYPVVVVGYMANNLIPVRIGEVVRSYYLSLRERISAAATFGTVAVERASDVLALLFFFAVAALFVPVSGTLDQISSKVPGGQMSLIGISLLPFVIVAAAVVLATTVNHGTALALVERATSFLPTGLRQLFLALSSRLLQGLTVVRSARSLSVLFLLSLPVWGLEATMYYVIALGFDIRPAFDSQLSLVAGILVFTAAANLAGVFPSSAGSWGPFDFFGALALIALGVSPETATAYAITVHAALWLPVTVVGLGLLVRDGTSLHRLVKGARTQGVLPSEEAPKVATGGSGTAA